MPLDAALTAGSLILENEAETPITALMVQEGIVDIDALRTGAESIRVHRTLLDETGDTMAPTRLKLGQLIYAKVELENLSDRPLPVASWIGFPEDGNSSRTSAQANIDPTGSKANVNGASRMPTSGMTELKFSGPYRPAERLSMFMQSVLSPLGNLYCQGSKLWPCMRL